MKFSPKKYKNRQKFACCAPSCISKSNSNHSEIRFHKVPDENLTISKYNLFGNKEIVSLRSEWLKNLQKTYNSDTLYACSLHFTKDDYVFAGNFIVLESHMFIIILFKKLYCLYFKIYTHQEDC